MMERFYSYESIGIVEGTDCSMDESHWCTVSVQSSEGRGMHQTIHVQMNIGVIVDGENNNTEYFDVLLSIHSSRGLFIDQFELQVSFS